ncbi:hypothetical protein GH714_036016 [Hevea brasiliensis]|uniref:Ethylene insensitive 3-like DNA-binding domain-containing protein n=1 Tax=Hevea brasiliensis TaxID=3981 RepID=A0A6A6KYL5_HEVBR|nr:hypothetical protein GH714_036016 [Hevea brasiliensis]
MVEFHEEEDCPISWQGVGDEEEEDISYDDLKKRMWKDSMGMQKLKEKRGNEEPESLAKQEASRRKKMSRAQDSIPKYMVKIMKVCKTQGFVYGIVPEKGKPVMGSSDRLRQWWKERVRFDQNAPLAIAEFLPILEQDMPQIDDEEEDQSVATDRSKLGFSDKNSRTNHQFNCAYRPEESDNNSQEKNDGNFSDSAANLLPLYDQPLISLRLINANTDNTRDLLSVTDWGNTNTILENSNPNGKQSVMEIGEGSGFIMVEDYPNYWGTGIEDLALGVALQRQTENMGLNQNTSQENLNDDQGAITSIWDLGFE